jgi:site-specific recombinase XerD
MKRKGIPLDVICKISGHADIKTLQIYLGIDEADLHAAVAAL